MEKKEILILGRGLAGGMLAAELATRGHTVTVADDLGGKSASRTAAGLFNVITGRYAATTWQAAELLEHLHRFFRLPHLGGLARHLHFVPIYRPFLNIQEANDWAAKSADPFLRDIVRIASPSIESVLRNPFGGIQILPCGWLDTEPFLTSLEEILAEKLRVKFIRKRIGDEEMDATSGKVEGLGEFDAIVSAQGMAALNSKHWSALPLKPLKGQILELEIPGLELDFALSRGVFLIPKGGSRFTCGSTYENRFEDDEPTETGIQQLLQQLAQTVLLPAHVVSARAALRPTTPDRRPLLGRHPVHPMLWVLNGLGTKGVLQAPWCAVQLADLLEERVKIPPPSVDISRFQGDFS